MRMSYSRKKEVLDMPNLIEVQRDSYQWFLDEGLSEAFADISPITDIVASSAWSSPTLRLTWKVQSTRSRSVKNAMQHMRHR